jgi:hypothetical protein
MRRSICEGAILSIVILAYLPTLVVALLLAVLGIFVLAITSNITYILKCSLMVLLIYILYSAITAH